METRRVPELKPSEERLPSLMKAMLKLLDVLALEGMLASTVPWLVKAIVPAPEKVWPIEPMPEMVLSMLTKRPV